MRIQTLIILVSFLSSPVFAGEKPAKLTKKKWCCVQDDEEAKPLCVKSKVDPSKLKKPKGKVKKCSSKKWELAEKTK